jgi:hypothetical protein
MVACSHNHSGNKLPGRKVIWCRPQAEARDCIFKPKCHKLLSREVDMNQMTRRYGALGRLALELLRRCGMILGTKEWFATGGGQGHRLLSRRVHYGLVIFCNRLNLSGGSYV